MVLSLSFVGVGLPEPLTWRHLARHLRLTKREQKRACPVAWSHPSRGITGDLGGSLLETTK